MTVRLVASVAAVLSVAVGVWWWLWSAAPWVAVGVGVCAAVVGWSLCVAAGWGDDLDDDFGLLDAHRLDVERARMRGEGES